MTDRLEIDRLLRDLYAARIRGAPDALCGSYSNHARFEIESASHGSPISVTSVGVGEFRPLLSLMIKTFKITDQTILSTIVEGMKAAVHWRGTVHSRVTGTTVVTELVDLVEIRDNRIASYIEFFVPRQS